MKDFLKWIILKFNGVLGGLFCLFPIKSNRIIFNSFGGRQYSCNPKYISDKLRKEIGRNYEIIWAFREPHKFKHLEKEGIKIVPYVSVQRLFYERTAKISIGNTLFWIPFRKGQEHINTWHGGGAYKSVGLGEGGKNWFLIRHYKGSSQNTTLFLSSSRYFSRSVLTNDFDYYGEVLECGMPRNDRLVRCSDQKVREVHGQVCQRLYIAQENAIILYAPTWRYDTDAQISEIDIEGVLSAYERRFDRKAVFLYRAHHSTTALSMKNVIDATDYPDMQELLLACDMLISDYSSCIWDYSFTYKPCVLYTPDLEKYRQERGFVKDISEWHFPYYEDNESLVHGIENFDEEKFVAGMKQHHEDLGSCETGEATKIVCERIHDICFGGADAGGEQ